MRKLFLLFVLFGVCSAAFPVWSDLPVPFRPTRTHQHLENFYEGIDEIIIATQRPLNASDVGIFWSNLAKESLALKPENIHRIIKEEMEKTLTPEILERVKVSSRILDNVSLDGEQNPHVHINPHALIVRFVFGYERQMLDDKEILVGALQPHYFRLLPDFKKDIRKPNLVPKGFIITGPTKDNSESLTQAFRTMTNTISHGLNNVLKQKIMKPTPKGEEE